MVLQEIADIYLVYVIFSDDVIGKHVGPSSIICGSLVNTGYPNGLPHWVTYLGGCRS